MREPLPLLWKEVVALQTIAAAVSGATAGMIEESFVDTALGLMVYPITSLVISLIFSGFLYYYFSLVHQTFIDFRRLHTINVLALLPYFAMHALSGFLAPIDLVGFTFTGIVLIIGLTEQFQLSREKTVRVVIGLGVCFFFIWSIVQYRSVA